ncbi:MAG: Gfo/Idh/MocA family protein, partial [Saprospiraceae bacterium]
MRSYKFCAVLMFSCYFLSLYANNWNDTTKVRIAIAGLSHDHVGGFVFGRTHADAVIVGIYETSDSLFQYYAKKYNLPASLHYRDLNQMLDATRPQAVADFGSIAQHFATVEACAARKIHVMVEKPLALDHKTAKKMQALARQSDIQIITNYETSWYPSIYKLLELTQDPRFGKIRRIIVNDGHEGPAKLGLTKAFMEWLTDPRQSGGPIIDFGCYGANLSSWLLNGKVPKSVFAVAQRLEPQTYHAEDDVTIVLDYGDLTAVLQPSWKWTTSRKDIEVYGEGGYAIAATAFQS